MEAALAAKQVCHQLGREEPGSHPEQLPRPAMVAVSLAGRLAIHGGEQPVRHLQLAVPLRQWSGAAPPAAPPLANKKVMQAQLLSSPPWQPAYPSLAPLCIAMNSLPTSARQSPWQCRHLCWF